MTTRSHVPTLVGVLFTIASLFIVDPASAQSMEIDYSCGCAKKSENVGHGCQGSGSPVVTVPTSANGKQKARENGAKTRCGWVYKKSCPKVSCNISVTKVSERALSKDEQSRRKATKKTGIADKHADALAKFAQDNVVTIIVRATNDKSLPYQQRDTSEYRPKPLTLSALKTKKNGKSAGLIVNPDWKALVEEHDTAQKQKDVDAEVNKLKRSCNKVKSEDRKNSYCGWYLDKDGVLRDEKKRAVFGDYDLQGVYKGNELLDTNDSKEGKKLRRQLNQALDPDRKKKEDWLIQHGANDNYRKKGGKMGREPGKKENFLVFEPGGDTLQIKTPKKLKDYYGKKGFAWDYKCPTQEACK
jgi:hypothetical protein